MPKVAVFMSSNQFPPNADDRVLLTAFEGLGATAEPVVWDSGDDSAFDVGIVRSTWDYAQRAPEFYAWLKKIDSQLALHNPLPTIEWSMDKRYLFDLAARGVPVIDQVVVSRASRELILGAAAKNHWDRCVVKSVVSSGGRQVAVLEGDSEADWQVAERRLHPYLPVLVQPFIPEVLDGEYSIIAIAGEVTHAVLKRPLMGEFRVQDHYGGTVEPVSVSSSMKRIAELALEASEMPWSYARVDVIDRFDGPVVVELEMLEPELFLPQHPRAAVRLARRLLEET